MNITSSDEGLSSAELNGQVSVKGFNKNLGKTKLIHTEILVYRSSLNDVPIAFMTLMCFALGLGYAFYMSQTLTQSYGLGAVYLLVLISLLLAGSVLGTIIYRRMNVRYAVSNDGVKALRGIMSNRQIDSKLEYYQIRGTEIHRSFFQRLIGTGDLHVRGATSNDTGVAFLGIKNPYYYQSLIEERHRLEL